MKQPLPLSRTVQRCNARGLTAARRPPAAVVCLLLALLLFAFRLPVAAQAPVWQSARAVAAATAATSTTFSQVTATAVDAAGNVYLAGYFRNAVVLGGSTLTSSGSNDVFVAKFNPVSNQFVWAQRAGGTGDSKATALAVNGTSVYVVGGFNSTLADFGPATLTNSGSDASVFVAKLTDTGNTGSFVWAQRASGTLRSFASAVAVSGTSVYVAGHFDSPAMSFGPVTLTKGANSDPAAYNVFVAKLTDAGSTGSFAWAQQASGTGYGFDQPTVLATSGTAVYVAGIITSATVGFGPTTLTKAGPAGIPDGFVAKLTDAGSTGSFVWAQRVGGTGDDYVYALAISGTSVHIAGYFDSSTAGFGSIILPNPAPGYPVGFLASFTDNILTATTAASPREAAHLYPNPARHTATLHLPTGTAPAPLTLTNAQGRAVRQYPAPAGPEAVLDLRGLPAGLYLLRGTGPSQRLAVE